MDQMHFTQKKCHCIYVRTVAMNIAFKLLNYCLWLWIYGMTHFSYRILLLFIDYTKEVLEKQF